MAISVAPKKKHRSSQSSPSHYTLRVELLGIQPTIWADRSDGRTHSTCCITSSRPPWAGRIPTCTSSRFATSTTGCLIPSSTDPGWEVLDERKYRLNQLLAEGDSCHYLDAAIFGDGWQHRVTVEAIEDVKPSPNDEGFAWVESGERACPPDDAGGSGGYQDFLDQLENDPYGDETKAFQEWAGLDFDPARFDRQAGECHHRPHALEPLESRIGP